MRIAARSLHCFMRFPLRVTLFNSSTALIFFETDWQQQAVGYLDARDPHPMNDSLRDRIIRHLEPLTDERGYQVLDYVEFLESKYAGSVAPSPSLFTRFTEGVEDTLRAGKVSTTAIAETVGLLNKAVGVLSGVAAAGKSVASDIATAGKNVASDIAAVATKAAEAATAAATSVATPPSPAQQQSPPSSPQPTPPPAQPNTPSGTAAPDSGFPPDGG